MAPAKLGEKTVEQLSLALKDHFQPKKVAIAKRFKFHRRDQGVGETVTRYVAELRKLASDCQFEAYLDQALRDWFVCGLCSEATQKWLLTKAELTFARAVEIAQGIEAVERDTIQLHASGTGVAGTAVGKMNLSHACHHCGRKNHTLKDCRYQDSVCHKCQKKGHLASVCRSKKQLERE